MARKKLKVPRGTANWQHGLTCKAGAKLKIAAKQFSLKILILESSESRLFVSSRSIRLSPLFVEAFILRCVVDPKQTFPLPVVP